MFTAEVAREIWTERLTQAFTLPTTIDGWMDENGFNIRVITPALPLGRIEVIHRDTLPLSDMGLAGVMDHVIHGLVREQWLAIYWPDLP